MKHVIVSKANKSLIVPAEENVVGMWPHAPRLPGGNAIDGIVIPHGLRETLMLRHLGYKVPNPMTYGLYNWPGGVPFQVQKTTCELLTENVRAYVLNDMGTGKTKSALWAWDYLYSQGLVGKLLVVAPLSTLNFVWASEAFATLPHRKVTVLHGSKERRLDRLREEADIYVINHDGLKVIGSELGVRTDITALVLDELAVYRNNSERSKYMRVFAQRFDVIWGMTGRPMPNEPTDVWAQCKIITPTTIPKTKRVAEQVLMRKISQFVSVPKPDAVDTAFKWMQPAVRFSLDDVVELPPIVYRTIDVDLSTQQEKLYKQLLTQLKIMVDQHKVTAVNAGVAMGKLLQIAGGWVYSSSPDFVKLDAKPRVKALLDILDSVDGKVLLFVPYRHMLNGLSEIMVEEKIDHAVVHGDTRGRDQIFNTFQNTPSIRVLMAHPECVSHGLTLTTAKTAIWYLPTASLETYEQANARIRRVGQTGKQQVLHLQSTPVEKKLFSLLRSKQKIQTQLLQMFADATAAK